MNFFTLSSSSSSSSNESSDEELLLLALLTGNDPEHPVKIKDYMEDTVVHNLPEDFRTHFRLTKSTIETLICDMQISEVSCLGRSPVPAEKSLLVTIWVLTNQESLRSVGERFNMSRGHLHRLYVNVCKKINANIGKYIVWPTGAKAVENINGFNNLRGQNSFPNVFGCVDCSHIPISKRLNDNSYCNRKGFHSVLLQGICNYKMQFINIFVGWPGSSHDAQMWINSNIYKKLKTDRATWLPDNTYLLGDTAYPLDSFIMVPYKDNGHLTSRHHQFNQKLSSSRVIIEHSYCRLKGLFRKLKYVEVHSVELAKEIIMTCCILHNLGINDEVLYEQEDKTDESQQCTDANDTSNARDDCPLASQLRDKLMEQLTD